MGFFSKIFKGVKKLVAPAIGFAVGGPTGAAIGGAIGGATGGGGIKGAITGGLTGYGLGTGLGALGSAAGAMGANLAPGAFGPVTGLAGGAQVFKNALLGGATSGIFNKVVGHANLLGAIVGGSSSGRGIQSAPLAGKFQQPTPSQPLALTRPAAISAPASLSSIANFDSAQTRSALATEGVNRGLGADEDSYYRNLVQRSLIGDDSTITDSLNSFLPVESRYFSQRGLDMSSTENFLRQIRGY